MEKEFQIVDQTKKTGALIAPRFLFQFAIPVLRTEAKWSLAGVALGEEYRLLDLASLDDGTGFQEQPFADVRMAWNPEGLFFTVKVKTKRQAPWCRDSRLDESDGLQVWIDTRATHNIHRASKFCHRFAFLPAGSGRQLAEPFADQLLINRARENTRPIRPRELQVASKVLKNGYELRAFVPAMALQGYDTDQQTKLGFTYAIFDRELGLQTFASGPGFPFDEDPSCWATLDLVEK